QTLVDVYRQTRAQEVVVHHRRERRSHGHGYAKLEAFGTHLLEPRQNGHISFHDAFKKPIFFEEISVFGMANERKVGVQHQRQITGGAFQEGTGSFCDIANSREDHSSALVPPGLYFPHRSLAERLERLRSRTSMKMASVFGLGETRGVRIGRERN